MIKKYSYKKKPDNSKIYYKIRQYQVSGNAYFEKQQWAYLAAISNQKKQNLKYILNRPEYRTVFDLQLDIPRLREGIKLNTIHTILTIKYNKVKIYIQVL